mmetsp:Transcript_47320/g.143296  ORF Transcript_47320/g.143296 Transcript_47320/m.143296 type:complete len:204 (-) Transcript_47320:788-1399(-)
MMNIQPSIKKFATQNDVEPHLIPRGLGKAPPPFMRLMKRTTTNMVTRTMMFIMGASLSSSMICLSSSSISSSSSSRLTSSAPSSSLPPSPRSPSRRWSLASTSSSSCAMRVSSLSFVPSSRMPISSLMCRLSAAYILSDFLRVLYAVKDKSATSITTRNVSGRTLFRNAPMSAPAMVRGSITSIRSQSTRGRSARGWRFLVLR